MNRTGELKESEDVLLLVLVDLLLFGDRRDCLRELFFLGDFLRLSILSFMESWLMALVSESIGDIFFYSSTI